MFMARFLQTTRAAGPTGVEVMQNVKLLYNNDGACACTRLMRAGGTRSTPCMCMYATMRVDGPMWIRVGGSTY